MKRLLSLVLALTVLLSTVAITVVSEKTDTWEIFETGTLYAIPSDAGQVLLNEKVYTVIRTYEEFAAAFPIGMPGLPNQNYILAADIDCTGKTFSGPTFTFAKGTVLEGNGFGLVNLTVSDGIMDLVKGDVITFRNFHIGTAENPVVINNPEKGGTTGVVSSYTNSNTRWENCHLYADISVMNGDVGAWMGQAKGEHTFVDCTIHGNVSTTNGGNVGLWIGGDNAIGSLTLNMEGCKTYGSVTSSNNSGSVIGWCPSNLNLKNCVNYANIFGVNAGGFIGNSADCAMSLRFEGCVNYGSVSGSSESALIGGFCGQERHLDAVYLSCVNFGNVSTVKNGAGFVANLGNNSDFTDCLNVGSVCKSVQGEHLGGIVGWGISTVSGCVNIGLIDGYNTAGNLVGKGAPAVIKNSWGFGRTQGAAANGRIMGADGGASTFEGNKFLETVAGSVSIGAEDQDAVSLPDAVAMLQEKYPQYHFLATTDGSIALADASFRAIQTTAPADGKMNFRLLGTVDSLSFSQVGFVGKVLYTDEAGETVTREITLEESGTTTVHKNILSGHQITTAADLHGSYVYTLKLVGLPDTGEVVLQFSPVSVLPDNGQDIADRQLVGAPVTVRYADGKFVSALSGTVEETVAPAVTVLSAYTAGGEDASDVDPAPDEAHDHPYSIPADATEFVIGEDTYTVIRTFDALTEALKSETVATGDGENTTVIAHTVHLILADTINGGGSELGAASLMVGAGSVIEGNGYTLYNYAGAGIFSFGNGAQITVRNFCLGSEKTPVSVYVPAGGNGTGIVTGYTNSVTRWENCHVYADLTVTGGGNVALWMGAAKGTHTFVDCTTHGSVLSTNNSGAWVGYLWDGESNLTFENCTNEASIEGSANAGGFIAHVNQQVGNETLIFTNCTNKGAVSGGNVGGFMGQNRKNVIFTGCVNEGPLTGTGNTGGLIGATSTDSTATVSILSCTNNGKVIGGGNAAGFVANNQITECTIRNSVNRGEITSGTHAGGFISWSAYKLTVENCLNAGTISGAHTAGIVGRLDCVKGATISGCANIGNIKQAVGNGSATNIGGYATSGLTMTDCYGFGYLETIHYPGIMVCQYSSVTTFSGNKYFEFGNTTASTTIGLDDESRVATPEDAVVLLEARFTDLDFEIVDGRILLRTADTN